MKISMIRILITGCLVIQAGCSFFSQEPGSTGQPVYQQPQAGSLPAIATDPFPLPQSEEEIADNSVYGYVVVKVSPGFDIQYFSLSGAEIRARFSLGNYRYFYLYKENGVLELLNRLKHTAGVCCAEPDWKMALSDAITYPEIPDDPYFRSAQYAACITQLDKALAAFGVGPHRVYVAAIDTGLNPLHEEFQGVFDHGYSFFTKNANNEYNAVENWDNPVLMNDTNWDGNNEEGHGSHVAGIIAGLGNNGKGICGFCPGNAKLVMYKCFANNPDGTSVSNSGSYWAIYGCLRHLVNQKIAAGITQTVVVNISITGRALTMLVSDIIAYGLKNNVLVIASSGNDGMRINHYPAACPGVMAVGATDGRDEIVPFSNTGAYLSVTAPGKDIISLGNKKNNQYVFKSGTSMAAPMVTGLAAYMLTFDPFLTPTEIKSLIEENADDLGSPGFDEVFGHGRINVYNTIRAVVNHVQTGSSLSPAYTPYSIIARMKNRNAGYSSGNPASPRALINQPVYLYDENGSFVTCNMTSYSGEACFPFLRKGRYILDANYFNKRLYNSAPARKQVDFTNPKSDVSVDFEYDVPIYRLQVLADACNQNIGKAGRAYTSSNLYDSDHKLLITANLDWLQTLSYPLEPGQNYYWTIEPYAERRTDGSIYYWDGDYALVVSTSTVTDAPGAAVLAGNPLYDSYEPNDSFESATEITCDMVYYSFLSAGIPDQSLGIDMIDYFKIMVTP